MAPLQRAYSIARQCHRRRLSAKVGARSSPLRGDGVLQRSRVMARRIAAATGTAIVSAWRHGYNHSVEGPLIE
jgi:hypothetical protein